MMTEEEAAAAAAAAAYAAPVDMRFAQPEAMPPAALPHHSHSAAFLADGGAAAATFSSSSYSEAMPASSSHQGPPGAVAQQQQQQQQQQGGLQAPVVTGVVGFEIINEMFQRQARRLETQLQQQANDRKAVEYTQAQLLVMQAQLQWHAAQYQERAEQVTKSSETIARMQSYVGTMESERARAVHTAQYLARDVAALRDQMEHQQPAKLATLSTTLSEMAFHGADLSTLDGIGALFTMHAGGDTSGSTSSGGAGMSTQRTVQHSLQPKAAEGAVGASASGMADASGANRRLRGGGEGLGAQDASQLASNVRQGRLPGPLGVASYDGGGASGSGGEGGSSSASDSKRRSDSNGERDTNSFDNSSSDSADAASAASTWPKAIAARRGERYGKDGAVSSHARGGHAQSLALADHAANDSGDSAHSSARQDSPPENDSSSSGGQLSDHGSHQPKPRAPPAAGGGHSVSAAVAAAEEASNLAAAVGCPTTAPGEMRQGLVDTTALHGRASSLPPLAPVGLSQGLVGAPGTRGPSAAAGNPATGPPLRLAQPPAPVLQGVLPFPGQGVVDLQQGVVSGGNGLEAFRYIDLGHCNLTPFQPSSVSAPPQLAPPPPPQEAQQSQPRSQPTRDCEGTEPPAKRTAAASLGGGATAHAGDDMPSSTDGGEATAVMMETE